MEITKTGVAGTLESCDASVTIEPGPRLEVLVESADKRFAGRVREAAASALAELGVKAARVTVREKSALDCTVRARVMTACLRAAGIEGAPWEALK
jgi:citrate lyase subunit gamma (acyl carrier protein)